MTGAGKKYNILLNDKGEILIVLDSREGGPENPLMVYDGKDMALLYRSRESAVKIENIHVDARTPLKSVNSLIIVEIENDEVTREYSVPMRVISSVQALFED